MRTLLSLTFIALTLFGSAQINEKKRANHWLFANRAYVDFTTCSPQSLSGSQMNSFEGSASISDINGNLLMYTDGVSVWDRNHTVMPNGTGLMGNQSTVQSAVIIPNPANANKYYIFTAGTSIENNGTVGVRYSEVDMTLNSGLGDVLPATKNTLLFVPNEEKLTAVRNAAGNGYWVVAQEKSSSKWYAYEVTATGVSAPVISVTGPGARPNNSLGAKLSPDGTMLVSQAGCSGGSPPQPNWNANLTMYGFNNATGVITYRWSDCGTPGFNLEFSPDCSKLYAAGSHMFQYDLKAGTGSGVGADTIPIKASKTQLTSSTWQVDALQLAPDCKIYVAIGGTQVGIIQNPNLAGTACGYNTNAFNLTSGNLGQRFPNFVQSFFEFPCEVFYTFKDTCLNDTTFFTLEYCGTVDSVKWNFNDPLGLPGNTSTLFNPYHIFSAAGNYNVQVISYVGGVADTFITVVPISPCNTSLTVSLNQDTTICDGNCVNLLASSSGAVGPVTYTWTPNIGSGAGPHNVCPNVTTTYKVVANDGTNADSTTVTITVNPNSSDSSQTSICSGDSILIHGVYQKLAGTYSQTFAAANGCDSISKVTLSVIPTINTADSIYICTGQSVIIHGVSQNTTGVYSATFNGSNGCDSISSISLFVGNAVVNNTSASICQGDSLFVGGAYQSNQGTYSDTIVGGAVSGCDSVIITNLSVIQPVYSSTNVSACKGDSILVSGTYYYQSDSVAQYLSASNGCDSIALTIINFNDTFNIQSNQVICEGDSLFVGGGYQTSSGTYYDSYQTSNGCDSIVQTSLTVAPKPTAFAGNDTTVGINVPVQLNGSGGTTYVWYPSTGLNCQSCQSPTATNNNSIIYTLVVTDANGCSDSDQVSITIDETVNLFIPNVFSPNGDGNNDIFFIRGNGIQEINLAVFSRWGEKVFESTDLKSGWDGFYKGEKMNPGVFVYYLTATMVTGEVINKHGNITLIK